MYGLLTIIIDMGHNIYNYFFDSSQAAIVEALRESQFKAAIKLNSDYVKLIKIILAENRNVNAKYEEMVMAGAQMLDVVNLKNSEIKELNDLLSVCQERLEVAEYNVETLKNHLIKYRSKFIEYGEWKRNAVRLIDSLHMENGQLKSENYTLAWEIKSLKSQLYELKKD